MSMLSCLITLYALVMALHLYINLLVILLRACNVSIVGNNFLVDLLTKGPKYREPWSFSCNTNFNSIMNAVEDYSRKWDKKEGVYDSAFSEWVQATFS